MHHPWTHWPTAGLLALVALGGLLADPASASLVHRYTFENGAADAVGGLDGTPSGATIDTGDAKEGSYSAAFDGTNDSIGFDATAFNATAFSVAMWVKLDHLDTYHGLLANKKAAGNPGFSMFVTGGGATSGKLGAEAVSSSGSDAAYTGEGVMDSLVWRHLAYTFDVTGGQARIYLEGADETTDSDIQSNFKWDGPWRLGLFMDDSNDLDGRLDDVQIYDEVLSPGAVAFLADNPGAVIPEPVTTIGLLLGGAALTAYSRRRKG